jgi:hypothetical protein
MIPSAPVSRRLEEAAPPPSQRARRVALLRELVFRGSFAVDPAALAQAMWRFLSRRGGSPAGGGRQ